MLTADSHCHLTMEAFDADRTEVLERAARQGVSLFVTVPARKGDAAACAALASSDPRIWATAGLHPHEARVWDEEAASELRSALAHPRVVAVGEIGLDFHYDLSPREAQARAFREQIAIAREFRRPIVIHTRRAAAETLAILKEERAAETGGIVHCFTEDRAFATAALDLGFYVSFSGIVTFPKASAIQEAARAVPQDRFLVETDAPYLAPVPHRGKRNEPALLPETIGFIARLRGEDPQALGIAALENCRRALRLELLNS